MNMIKQNYHELTPAYGNDYKSKKEVEQAFRNGKDFAGDYSLGFKYCSIRDFEPKVKVLLRYKKLTQVAWVAV
jgi:hypothetical protein